MAGWHHRIDGHEFEQAPGVGDGQGGLACCCPWGRRESDTTEQLNNNNKSVLWSGSREPENLPQISKQTSRQTASVQPAEVGILTTTTTMTKAKVER